MIVMWLVAPVLITIAVGLIGWFLTEEFAEVARRERAMRVLEERHGHRVQDDGDRSAGWVVHPDGQWPRRVRLFRFGRSTGSVVFEETEADEAISGEAVTHEQR